MAAQKSQKEEDERPRPSVVPVESRGDDAGSAVAPAPESALAEQVQKLAAEKQDLTNTLVRLQADFDNYRKRTDKERDQARHRGVENIIEQLLPVLDGFDRALAAHDDPAYEDYRKGFELIRKQLWDSTRQAGSPSNRVCWQRIRSQCASRCGARAHHRLSRWRGDRRIPAGVHIPQSSAASSNGARGERPPELMFALFCQALKKSEFSDSFSSDRIHI